MTGRDAESRNPSIAPSRALSSIGRPATSGSNPHRLRINPQLFCGAARMMGGYEMPKLMTFIQKPI
jgi:hypothetical protein